MTEQIPSASPTHGNEQQPKPQARRSVARTRRRSQRDQRFSGRFGEAALRWPEPGAIAVPTSMENPGQGHARSSRDVQRSLAADLNAPPGDRWLVPAIRRGPVIPRGPGPPRRRVRTGPDEASVVQEGARDCPGVLFVARPAATPAYPRS